MRHLEEKPDLVSLWGSDIPWDNEAGWKVLYDVLQKSARQFDLRLITVRTTFRRVISEGALTSTYQDILGDNWWHGVQHGIAIISHAAPCDWLRGVSRQYIAASWSPKDRVTCASSPTIDNYVRFCGAQVYHDAYWTRLEKIKVVVDYCRKEQVKIDMHVCWQTTDGRNCCHCEKCYRTIIGLLVENANPNEYGFAATPAVLKQLRSYMSTEFPFNKDSYTVNFWRQLQTRERENHEVIRTNPNYKYIAWLHTYDFDHPERYWKRRAKRAADKGQDICRRAVNKLRRGVHRVLK